MADDRYDDDRPGMMRVHIAQEREADMREQFSLAGLQLHAAKRGLDASGTKAALAARLVEAGFTRVDLLRGDMESRHTRGRAGGDTTRG